MKVVFVYTKDIIWIKQVLQMKLILDNLQKLALNNYIERLLLSSFYDEQISRMG